MKFALLFALVLGLGSTAFATPITVSAFLSGPQESPPTSSPGTGFAMVVFDPVAHLLTVSATFSGLTTSSTTAHIHCCTAVPLTGTAGVATQVPAFRLFPLGATSGTFSQTYVTTDSLL
jgi:hypothetical protein